MMSARRALLVVNPDKPNAIKAVDRIREAIESHGALAGVCEGNTLCLDDTKDADVVIALGGDGTILSLSRRLLGSDRPLMGVNFGRLGFLAEFTLDGFLEQAADLLDGSKELQVSERPVIEVEVWSERGERKEGCCALNEAAVTAGPPYRMIEIELSIGGEAGPTARGDGVLVATPFGSTAYNASAGGPIIVPGAEVMAVTPIAAHSLAFRPIVAPKDDVVELTMKRTNRSDRGGTTLVLDGQQQVSLEQGDRVRLWIGDRRAPLVRNPRWSYWRTLMDKLHWGAEPSNGDLSRGESGDEDAGG